MEMLFLANPGEVPRPLRKIASGGELSRLTLAAKTVLACTDRVATLVLDEVDTGVGGRLGAVLGKTLAELAQHHQVVCVTHLPQVASFAAPPVGHPQADRTGTHPDHDHSPERPRSRRRAGRHAPRQFGRRRHPPGGDGDVAGSPGLGIAGSQVPQSSSTRRTPHGQTTLMPTTAIPQLGATRSTFDATDRSRAFPSWRGPACAGLDHRRLHGDAAGTCRAGCWATS